VDLVIYDLRRTYEGSAIGFGWTVLQPLLYLGLYFFLFAVLRIARGGSHGDLEQLLLVFSGIVPWYFLLRGMSHGVVALTSHAPLVKLGNFSQDALPAVSVVLSLVDLSIGVLALLAMAFVAGTVTGATLLLVPLLLLLTLLLFGLTTVVAPLAEMLPDVRRLVPPFMRLTFFVTPVVYMPDMVPEAFRWILEMNPLTYVIGLMRYAMVHSEAGLVFGVWPDLAVVLTCTAVVGTVAYLVRGPSQRLVVDYL